jgi:hypothetical protein
MDRVHTPSAWIESGSVDLDQTMATGLDMRMVAGGDRRWPVCWSRGAEAL